MWIWLQITFGASYSYSAEAEAPTLWPPDVKTRPTGKDPDAGKDWRQEEKEKEVTEDEMVGWHHQFNGHETEQTLGDRGCPQSGGMLSITLTDSSRK